MDLSNFLLIRTRERILFESKVNAPVSVLQKGKTTWTNPTNTSILLAIRKELIEGLQSLQKALYVSKGSENLPVAFATNALYVLERNGGGNRDDY